MKFKCPRCKRCLKAKPNLVGRRVQCPTCGVIIQLPKKEWLGMMLYRSVN